MDIVCTLYEKHYDYGVGALCNSLVNSDFEGIIMVGYKGNLPFWLSQTKKINSNTYEINEKITLQLISLAHIEIHFGYYKPQFILDCYQLNPNFNSICYFDPDICLDAPWSFIKGWISCGVALATDNCYTYLHHNHPWRKQWIALFKDREIIHRPEFYINSGFIGLKSDDLALMKLWKEAITIYQNNGGDVLSFDKNSLSGLKGDQDLLNAALMYYSGNRLSVIGKEAMGFEQPSYIMGHAVNSIKPWKNNFIKNLILQNIKPSYAEKLFFKNCIGKIILFSKLKFYLKYTNIKISSLLGRYL